MSSRPQTHLAERLALRLCELIDIASESGDEATAAAWVIETLRDAGVPVRDAHDTCVLAGALADGLTGPRPLIVLAGHLDTVPAQDNRPSRRADGAVHGLGAADMKSALAVMIELASSLVAEPTVGPYELGLIFFGREELPVAESALSPLLEREAALRDAALVLMMEPTDNAIHAGCLGNLNASWVFHGRSGHSGRPWTADNAITRAAKGINELSAVPYTEHTFGGLTFREAVSVTKIVGGIADNVIPDRVDAHVNYRYPPGLEAATAERRLRDLCEPHGTLTLLSNAPSAPVVLDNPIVTRLKSLGSLDVEAKQAWTPIAEFAAFDIPAVNFGPGDPRWAHRRDEHVTEDALVRSYSLLHALLRGETTL